ncbi:MAG: hypothetical protein EPN75_00395 [Beijerinckiaceae bacterium]|nr:MAG: hypothetical protein EPN75_00395 [Beijerinckiaceae bacterium]
MPANGSGERIAALAMIEPRADPLTAITLGADKGYDAADFVNELKDSFLDAETGFALFTPRSVDSTSVLSAAICAAR